MNFITIGGVPAAGKTYTSKLLAKQNSFLALELEPLRWDFFNNDLEKNLYKYTQHTPMLKNENMREYYLRCALYENRIPLELLVKWLFSIFYSFVFHLCTSKSYMSSSA